MGNFLGSDTRTFSAVKTTPLLLVDLLAFAGLREIFGVDSRFENDRFPLDKDAVSGVELTSRTCYTPASGVV